MLAARDSAISRPSMEFLDNDPREVNRTHVTTYADHACAIANPNLRRNCSCECRVLLLPAPEASSCSGGFLLGNPCRAASPRGELSMRYACVAIGPRRRS